MSFYAYGARRFRAGVARPQRIRAAAASWAAWTPSGQFVQTLEHRSFCFACVCARSCGSSGKEFPLLRGQPPRAGRLSWHQTSVAVASRGRLGHRAVTPSSHRRRFVYKHVFRFVYCIGTRFSEDLTMSSHSYMGSLSRPSGPVASMPGLQRLHGIAEEFLRSMFLGLLNKDSVRARSPGK
jgi:hypothetical protein